MYGLKINKVAALPSNGSGKQRLGSRQTENNVGVQTYWALHCYTPLHPPVLYKHNVDTNICNLKSVFNVVPL